MGGLKKATGHRPRIKRGAICMRRKPYIDNSPFVSIAGKSDRAETRTGRD